MVNQFVSLFSRRAASRRRETGATSVSTITVGTSAGGAQYVVAQSVTTATAVDTDFGTDIAQLGTTFDANKGYRWILKRADSSRAVVLRQAISVANTTGGQLRWRVVGFEGH